MLKTVDSSPGYSMLYMVRSILIMAGLYVALGSPQDATAQTPGAQEQFELGTAALAAGDTAEGLAHLRRAVDIDPDFAEAYFRLGQVLSKRASAEAVDSGDRLMAKNALEEALRIDPGNPQYTLELALLLLKQQIRVDGRRLLRRALEQAARADAETYAEIHFQLALFEEEQWLRLRDRHIPRPDMSMISGELAMRDARYAWDLTEPSTYGGDQQGYLRREAMVDHLEEALKANPGHVGASLHMLAFLYDEGLADQYMEFARRFVRYVPEEPMAYMALGLGLTWEGQADEATGAFEIGLAMMDEYERRAYENVGQLMSRELEEEYQELTPVEREITRDRFWRQNNPMFLTPTNEYWLDYMSRMTYVDMRFGVLEYNLRGWETDRGLIHLRYGSPARIATFSSVQGDGDSFGVVRTLWAYSPDGPAFLFSQNPGFRRALFADDFRWYADEYRHIQPSRMLAPSIPERYPVSMQFARFRAMDDSDMMLEVHALLPLDRLSKNVDVESGQVETGFFVLDQAARQLVRSTDSEVMDFTAEVEERIQSWRVELPARGEHLVSVEAREPLTWHAAVGRAAVEARSFPAGQLAVSDILLAEEVEPTSVSPIEREDFRIVAKPGVTYDSGEQIALYFEVYDLVPDDDDYASYEVELAFGLEAIDREKRTLLAQYIGELADRWGFTAVGTDAVYVTFEKQVRLRAQEVVPDYFTVVIPEAPAGTYEIRIKVTDLVSGEEARSERVFSIVEGKKEDEPGR